MPLFPRPLYVVGSINQDVVLRCDRVPAAGETRVGGDLRFLPGGKGANQAVAAVRAGARVAFYGRIGEDAFGQGLKDGLAAEGIDVTDGTRSPLSGVPGCVGR